MTLKRRTSESDGIALCGRAGGGVDLGGRGEDEDCEGDKECDGS